ncbi:MAG: ubiquinol-cytochrome c reductase iron-sulfur subunit [Chloroflexota bacterium]
MPKSPSMSRREFVTMVSAALGGVMGAVIGIPAIGYLLSPALKTQKSEAWIPLGKLEDYPLNTPTLFTFTRTKVNGWEKTVYSYGVYILRTSESEVKVLSNLCTHLSCRVTWKEEANEYLCPCHDGHFDIQGNVDSGPPPRPLDTYETKIEDGNLFMFFKES